MEMDLTREQRALVVELLRNWGPGDMSDKDEEFLQRFADLLADCGEVSTTLHINP